MYFIAETKTKLPVTKTTPNSMRENTVSEEISDLKWVTAEESAEYVVSRRVDLLKMVEKKLKEYHKFHKTE